MNMLTRVISGFFVVILICLILLLPACSSPNEINPLPTKGNNISTPTIQPSPPSDDFVELVYFHRTQRCYSCQYAGDMTQNTVESYFSDELTNGKLIFKMLDVQDSANAEMIDKYEPYGSSLFINMVMGGQDRIQAITDIWFHIGDDDKFISAVKTEIDNALESI